MAAVASLAGLDPRRSLALSVPVLAAVPLWFLVKSAVQALFTRLPAPEGLEIMREQAPALFAAIDDMRRRMKGPRFHHVLVTDEMNAAVVQRPLFGLVGWPRNYLVLGLPLLEALVDRALKSLMPLPSGALGPIEQLRQVAWRVRDLAIHQPNLCLHLVVHRLDGKVGLSFCDQLATIFLAATPDEETAARLFATYGFFVRGAVAVAANAKAVGTGAVEPPDPARVPNDFPSFSALAPHFSGKDFEVGLDLMLAGFAAAFRP